MWPGFALRVGAKFIVPAGKVPDALTGAVLRSGIGLPPRRYNSITHTRIDVGKSLIF